MQAAQTINIMQAATIPRVVAEYHDDAVKGNPIASATGIRKSFFETNSFNEIHNFFPKLPIMPYANGKQPPFLRELGNFLSFSAVYNPP